MLPQILGTLDEAVLAIDAHGKVIASNAAADALLGLGDSGPGSRAHALYAPDAGKKGPPAESPLLRALKGQSIKGATFSVGRPNEPGSRRVSVSAKPVLDPDGRTRGAVMTLRDVTDAKASPAPARKVEPPPLPRPPEEAFGKVFEDAPVAIALLGLDGRVARANGALCHLLGCLPEELVGRDPGKLVHADDVKKEEPLLRQLLSGEITSYEVDKRFTIKTGDKGKEMPLLVRWAACAVRAASGEVSGALAFVDEVKDKKPEGRLARETQDMLRLVLDTVPVGVWVTDTEGRVKLANPAGRKIWSKDEAVARFEQGEYKGFWADSGKRIEPDEWGALRAIATGEAQVDKAIQVQRFDGTRKTLLTSAVPMRAGDGTTSGAIVVQQEVPDAAAPGAGPARPTTGRRESPRRSPGQHLPPLPVVREEARRPRLLEAGPHLRARAPRRAARGHLSRVLEPRLRSVGRAHRRKDRRPASRSGARGVRLHAALRGRLPLHRGGQGPEAASPSASRGPGFPLHPRAPARGAGLEPASPDLASGPARRTAAQGAHEVAKAGADRQGSLSGAGFPRASVPGEGRRGPSWPPVRCSPRAAP